jgi:predicted AlkP superfamily phosphohydrolase/phosphomutase
VAKPRVAAIGIDAAEWSHVDEMIADGSLPNVEKVLGRSARATLHGDVPYRAEATWTELLTGRTPAENRYWTTALFDPATYDAWEIGAFRGSPFYARPDLQVVAFDIPHSVIAPDARGAQITAWGAHSPQFPTASSPSDLVARVDERFGVHRAPLSDSAAGWHNDDYGRNLADALVDGIRRKVDIVEWLLEEHRDWDLFCTVLSETHTAGHQFFHGTTGDHLLSGTPQAAQAGQRFREVWAAVDEAVGRLSALFDDDHTTFVLFAVHGMQGNGSDVTGLILLPELMHRLAFGSPFIDFPAWDPSQPPIALPPEQPASDHLLQFVTAPRSTMYGSRRGALKNQLAWQARRRLPTPVLDALTGAWRTATKAHDRHHWWEMAVRSPASPSIDLGTAGARKPLDYHVAAWYARYWPRMRSFIVPSFSDAHVRVNLVGRERDGIVPLAEYHQELDAVEALLRSVTDARTGRPVVDEIFRMRASDPLDPDGPTGDLVVTFAEVSDVIVHADTGPIGAAPMQRSGEHSNDGWVLVRPPGGASGDLGDRRPRDLAPTLVQLLGLPASPLVTGTSFADAIERP